MALSATELRIGNTVGFKNRTDCYCTVNELSSCGGIHLIRTFIDGTEDDQPEVIEDITGIPLTEEWLLKFGFEKHKYKAYHFIECGEYEMQVSVNCFSGSLTKESSWFVSIDTGYGSQPVSLVRQYVHQLQNLYFALTGEELKLVK